MSRSLWESVLNLPALLLRVVYCPLVAGLLMLGVSAMAADVRFPGGHSSEDRRWDFQIALLELALSKTAVAGVPDRVIRLPSQMQARRISELENDRLDVAPLFATRRLPASPIAVIPLPLTRGLLGWRLLLVGRDISGRMAAVRTLRDLQPYRLGFSTAFSDFELMKAAGFNIVYAGRYESLFKMLEAGRLDWLSRSITEIYHEEAAMRERGVQSVVVLPSVALHYPADWYFAVSPHRPELRQRIEQGLRLALEDGAYARLFEAHFGRILRNFEGESRQVIEIENPDFPKLSAELPADWVWKPRPMVGRH